ncbi:MAG: hypothetical protein PHH93_03320 [Prolixibacteraceae bacterium]|nr:hypothetical protein [Prolixibacteraceae bacterium]
MNRENHEIKLIRALKIGDAKVFDKLFSLYGNRLYHFTYGYLKSKESAEEVVLDYSCAFGEALQSLNRNFHLERTFLKLLITLFWRLLDRRRY